MAFRQTASRASSVAQVIGQGPSLIADPCLEGGDELRLVDEPHLQRDQPEQEFAVGIGGHGKAPGHDVVRATTGLGTAARA